MTRVTPTTATVVIMAAGGTPLESPTFAGVVRLEDVTQVHAEEVEMMECYRLGDIVLARVISLGDSRTFFLTTAEEQLGVCIAMSKASGAELRPLSYKEMEDPVTGAKESRKVAKPVASDGGSKT